ncbi:arylamine N-acetyltransferase [Streptomyces sp. XM4193]|uniref:arylamine N-acetyltransferase family protein n=1 Tax=Streptomyces sp. XM4193 TaxID=2929782 RepID=UPI001FF8E474|nr:arylamine N-acetyltransferase [Streptomyces sp. XM4193]MCK1796824.1 arylamine N-acetyltransferase [Streptomyces sp. XM4193]
MDTSWDSDLLDLDAYLRRVDHHGERAATVGTLHALHRAHMLHIPFENLEIIAGRPVRLDLPSLERKMVRGRRGGYCFEHVLLFGAALEALGFGVEGFIGRVRLGQGDGPDLSETHAVLRVTTPDTGQRWLSDVGFGSAALAPVEFADGAEVSAGGRRWRLRKEDEWHWVLQQLVAVGGTDGSGSRSGGDDGSGAVVEAVDQHAFTLSPRRPVDYEVGNFYVSTWPRSPFVTRPFVTRVTAEGVVHSLDGLNHRVTLPDGSVTDERTYSPQEVPTALEGVFGVELDDRDASAVVRHLRERAER